MEKNKESIASVRYIDKELYERLVKTVQLKGGPYGNKRELINYVLQDYLEMNEIENMRNPYLIRIIREIVSSTVGEASWRQTLQAERRGGPECIHTQSDRL